MKAKILWIMIAVFLSLGVPAHAQQKPTASDIVVKMQSLLNLTSDQVSALEPIIANSMAQRQKLMQSLKDEMAAIHTQMKQLREAEDQKIGQILTSDQKSQWSNILKNRKHHSSAATN